MPQRNYTSVTRAKQPPKLRFDQMPPQGFEMPPMDREPKTGKTVLTVALFVFGGFALMYAITWIYGHFRWGW